ncbi:hypothetical protein Tco_0631491 [Tanacetum coccineum]
MARMEERLDQFVDQLADRINNMMNPRRHGDRNGWRSEGEESKNPFFKGEGSSLKEQPDRPRRNQREDNRRWESGMRVNIPEFDWDILNPERFIDWLVAVEEVFEFKEVPSNYHGDEEEGYPFVDNYPNFQEEENNVSFSGVVVGVEEELMPVYDTDIEDVIEEEEGFVGKVGFGGEEDNIEDVVVVANDLCYSMIQTTLSVDFEEDINTKSHELMSFGKSIIIKVSQSSFKFLIRKIYQEWYLKAAPMVDKFFKMIKVRGKSL